MIEQQIKEKCLEIADGWKSFWMNQTQNNEDDYKNYWRRAFGVDSNMLHNLARRFSDFHSQVLKDANDKITQLEKQVQAVSEQRDAVVKENAELKATLITEQLGSANYRRVSTEIYNKLTAQLAIATEALESVKDYFCACSIDDEIIPQVVAREALAKIKDVK